MFDEIPRDLNNSGLSCSVPFPFPHTHLRRLPDRIKGKSDWIDAFFQEPGVVRFAAAHARSIAAKKTFFFPRSFATVGAESAQEGKEAAHWIEKANGAKAAAADAGRLH